MTGPFVATANQVRAARSVVAVGAGTHCDIGGAPHATAEPVHAPAGVVDIQPSDMTVTVRGATSCRDLDDALAEHAQECPLDPRDPAATVAGTLSAGLSGRRRLGLGPLRNTVLEVVLVLADGRVVRGGGPTVKNVTGYDIPRLVVGSLGTLGVIVQATLRSQPRAVVSSWFRAPGDPDRIRAGLHAPTALLVGPEEVSVLLEGIRADIDVEADRIGLVGADAPPQPDGPHRGRLSVDPSRLGAVTASLREHTDVTWLAEWGVGTVHVAAADPSGLERARTVATTHGGWLLREAGAPDLDPFGTDFPASALQRRIRRVFDPEGKLAPGRVPATEGA